jgi:hypothetical protein
MPKVDMADTADMADRADITANILARYRREGDTSSVEAGRNSVAAHREHIGIGVAANGTAVNGAAVTGPAVHGTAVTGAAGTGAAVTGTAVTGTGVADSSLSADLVIRTTGVGTHIGAGATLTRTRTTAIILIGIILRMGTSMTTAPHQEGDFFTPNPPVILFRRVTNP